MSSRVKSSWICSSGVRVMFCSAMAAGLRGAKGTPSRCTARTVLLKLSYKLYAILFPKSVPWAAYILYPRTLVINLLKIRAVSSNVQFAGGTLENAKPGKDGIITSKDTGFPAGVLDSEVNGLIAGMNSKKDPGHP